MLYSGDPLTAVLHPLSNFSYILFSCYLYKNSGFVLIFFVVIKKFSGNLIFSYNIFGNSSFGITFFILIKFSILKLLTLFKLLLANF
jgi:hypothetical protein